MAIAHIQRPTYKQDKQPVEDRPLLQRLHWVHIVLLATTPLLALYGIATTNIRSETLVLAAV
ncbi:hypothetical protein IW136_004591, partial [Coemansia sp. RSA 678]